MKSSRLAFFAICLPLLAQDPDTFFENKVRPLLVTRCGTCHNAKTLRAGLDLTTASGFFRGADSGLIIDKQTPQNSKILHVTSYLQPLKMPPTGKLKDDELAILRTWVEAGAPWPKAEMANVDLNAPRKPKQTAANWKQFWAFKPVEAVAPPAVKATAWAKDPIDQFILAKLEEKGFAPAPPADKLTLIRRATYDLTGLPPTRAEVESFLADQSPNAYEKVLDRLLVSPRYGEKYGRHWLDVARYADSTGADEDHRYPYAWKYRDYVIQAINDDTPYDRFVTEQLAGDLLPSANGGVNKRGIIATGFLAIGPRLIAEQDKIKMWYDTIDEQIDTTAKAFLGLTIACARCHDHKFDPITTKDYYALASIFASTKSYDRLEGTVSQIHYPALVPTAEFAAWQAHQRRLRWMQREADLVLWHGRLVHLKSMGQQTAAYLNAVVEAGTADRAEETAKARQLDADVLKRWIKYLGNKDDVKPFLMPWQKADAAGQRAMAQEYQTRFLAGLAIVEKQVAQWRAEVDAAKGKGEQGPMDPRMPPDLDRFYSEVARGPYEFSPKSYELRLGADQHAKWKRLIADRDAFKKQAPPEPDRANGVSEGDPVQQHVFIRGSYAAKGDPVPKRFPVILAGDSQPGVANGSGRLELARWLTDPKHPLTSRVMVNRIWQWHFGEGIARTPSNFGLLGARPTHPQLLDYLASEFIKSGWSMKALHKRIMLTSTYQMSSETTAAKQEADPDNKLLGRYPRRRLQVEELRDTLLALDHKLDVTMGGTLQSGTGTDGENDEKRLSIRPEDYTRRTVYLPLRRSNLPTLLNLFDFGDATTPGEGRTQTNVAPQALFAMNSPFVAQRAQELAATWTGSDADKAAAAYWTVLRRNPSAAEAQTIQRYVAEFRQRFSGRDPWTSVCHLLLSSNEFLYVD